VIQSDFCTILELSEYVSINLYVTREDTKKSRYINTRFYIIELNFY
jgi:hypothetical protein